MTALQDQDRFESLIESYILGTLTEAESAVLNAQLAGSREARSVFRSRLAFHQLCYEVFADDQDAAGLPVAGRVPAAVSRGVAGQLALSVIGLAAVATGLLVVWFMATERPWLATPTMPVARVVTSDVLPLGPLPRGRLIVPTGFAEIEMAGGARFAIEAGAEIELLAADRVRLVRGELGADVPPQGRGFTVVTDDGEIVDWGTRFGVAVAAHRPTTAMVFSGEIEVVTASGSQLFQNRQAVALGSDGAVLPSDAAIDERGFPMPTREEVIPLVLGNFESPEDYAVAGGGGDAAAWVGDLCRIVGEQDGIRPAGGRRMLQLLAASPDGEASRQNFCNVGQRVVMPPCDLAGAEIEVSMQVNRLAVPKDIDTLFKLSVDDVSDGILATVPRGKTLLTAFVLSDADVESWETLAVRGELPPGVERLHILIGAQENVWNDQSGEAIEFDGHFIDEVQVRLILPARRSLF